MEQQDYGVFKEKLIGYDDMGNPKASITYATYEYTDDLSEDDIEYRFASSCYAKLYYPGDNSFICDICTTNTSDGGLIRLYNAAKEWLETLQDPQNVNIKVFNIILVTANGEPYAIEIANPSFFCLTMSSPELTAPDTVRFLVKRENLQCCTIAPSDEIK